MESSSETQKPAATEAVPPKLTEHTDGSNPTKSKDSQTSPKECEPDMKKAKKAAKKEKKNKRKKEEEGKEPKKRCAYWIPGKRRTCNMPPREGSLYCPTHEPNPDKVPCPLDPRHLVLKADLERHLAKCPGTGLTHASALPFYSKGINAPGEQEPAPEEGSSNVLWRSPERVARVVARLTEVSKAVPQEPPPLSVKRHEGAERTDREISRSTNGSGKHLPQISSIIKNMEDEGMLGGAAGTVYVEFGAGKAHLARLVAASVESGPDAAARLPFLLVDMARFSNKAESSTWRPHDSSPVFSRIQIDITDLDLSKVPEVMGPAARSVVGFGKHLCGAGCDTTIRCMVNAKERLPALKFHIAIALCCLHKCNWQSYCSKKKFFCISLVFILSSNSNNDSIVFVVYMYAYIFIFYFYFGVYGCA